MRKLFILCNILILMIQFSQAQQLEQVDQKIATYEDLNFSSPEELANKIELDFETEMEKARAIYSWIAQNISYDYALLRRGKYWYYTRGSTRKERKLQDERRYVEVAEKTFATKKGVCEGYASLFQRLCELVDLESNIIEGYSKTDLEDIKKKSPNADHAWNSVKVGSEWLLIDATWGAGYLDGNQFYPNFNDSYFNTSPERFALNHHVEERGFFSFLARRNFFQNPLFYEPYMNAEIKIVSPSSGALRITKNGKITFVVQSDELPENLSYNFSRDQYTSELNFKKRGSYYEAVIPKPRRKSKSLTIYHKDIGMVSYKCDFN